MQEIAKAIKLRALQLLNDGTVARVLGWEKGETETDWSPALFTTESEMENMMYGEYAGINLSKYCVKFNALEGKAVPGLRIILALFLEHIGFSTVVYPYFGGCQMIDSAVGAKGRSANSFGESGLFLFIFCEPDYLNLGVSFSQLFDYVFGIVTVASAVVAGDNYLVLFNGKKKGKSPNYSALDCFYYSFDLFHNFVSNQKSLFLK